MSDWSTISDIETKALREWTSQRILNGETKFPLRISLKSPSALEISKNFNKISDWVENLNKAQSKFGTFTLETIGKGLSGFGKNRIPNYAVINSEENLLNIINKKREKKQFEIIKSKVENNINELLPWVNRNPIRALSYHDKWDNFIRILIWFKRHQNPQVYMRQIDVPGVHTKFIDANKGILRELIDFSSPESIVDESKGGASNFNERYGLLSECPSVRFRVLDKNNYIEGLSDITTPVDNFVNLNIHVKHIFFTENKANFLTFPQVKNGMIIFGQGYGFGHLTTAKWLYDAENIFYWGDIDLDGFSILNQFRTSFPNAKSLLMDMDTLQKHHQFWVENDAIPKKNDHLTQDEAEVYNYICTSQSKPIRLEQELISYSLLKDALDEIDF